MILVNNGECRIEGSIREIIHDVLQVNTGYRKFLKARGWKDEDINKHMIKHLYAAADMQAADPAFKYYETTVREKKDE